MAAPTYTVKFKPSAAKDVGKLPRRDQISVLARISALSVDPRPAGARVLKGGDGFYRVRVGDYRVIYTVHDGLREVLILVVGHRRDVYRG